GWFDSFTRYKGKNAGSDVPAWLSMFDGGAASCHRKTGNPRDVEVERALAAVCGGVQPEILARVLSDPNYIACGLAARLILVWPPKRCPRWNDLELDPETEQRFAEVIHSLRSIPLNCKTGPTLIRLDHAALTRFRALSDEFADAAEAIDGGPMA